MQFALYLKIVYNSVCTEYYVFSHVSVNIFLNDTLKIVCFFRFTITTDGKAF